MDRARALVNSEHLGDVLNVYTDPVRGDVMVIGALRHTRRSGEFYRHLVLIGTTDRFVPLQPADPDLSAAPA
jgi:hypothetical protein